MLREQNLHVLTEGKKDSYMKWWMCEFTASFHKVHVYQITMMYYLIILDVDYTPVMLKFLKNYLFKNGDDGNAYHTGLIGVDENALHKLYSSKQN